ncbi:MAG: GSU2403 family nucleotidyltransferase fold protein [Rhodomicrobium sp.]
MARVNRALRINRVPITAAKVLRALDEGNLLGEGLFVIGTNSMYAYEMKAGILFESGIIATSDFDLLWDARDRLRLAASRLSPEGLLGILRSVDSTFSSRDDYGMRAQNASGYFVDLFCPEGEPPPERITPDDIDPIPTEGGDWLAAAPKIDEMVVGEDGLPARLICVDPRIFALHKAWLSEQQGRQPRSRPRDLKQAKVVAKVAREHLSLKLDGRLLRHLPAELAAYASALREDSTAARGGSRH